MKKIEVLIKSAKLDDAKDAIRGAGISGMTATEVSRITHDPELHRGALPRVDAVIRIKLEVVVHDDLLERIVQALVTLLRADGRGDGAILVSDVADALRIRTGEIAEAAIG